MVESERGDQTAGETPQKDARNDSHECVYVPDHKISKSGFGACKESKSGIVDDNSRPAEILDPLTCARWVAYVERHRL